MAGVREDGMEFSLFLSCYCPESKASTAEVYGEMLEMAQAAERLGYCGLTVPEHHFINILMNPNPFMLAVKVASVTERIPITTAVAVLPLNDMRRMAGEAALADVLTGGRLQIGVGRGAFPYEFERYGVDFAKSREIFDESLEVLIALMSGEEVSWDGAHYKFAPMTIMPRPVQRHHPPIWIAAMAPVALYPRTHFVRRVPTKVMHLFTLIQAGCLAGLWFVKASAFGILFPLFIAVLVPIRFALGKLFASEHLEILDADEGPEEESEAWS